VADQTGGAGDDWQQAVQWHRRVAAAVAAADRAGVATDQLPAIRARLLEQSTLLARAAARAGAPAPQLAPTPDDVAAAGPSLGDLSDAAGHQLLQNLWSTLARVDAVLGVSAPAPGGPVSPAPPARTVEGGWPSPHPAPAGQAAATGQPAAPAPAPAWGTTPPGDPAPPPAPSPHGPASAWALRGGGVARGIATRAGRSVVLRNAAVYGAYSAAVLAAQAVLFVLLDEESSLPMAAPLCLVVLPALAWAAGFVTIGAVFAPYPDGSVRRSPRLGIVICLVPNALLLCAVGVLFAANLVSR